MRLHRFYMQDRDFKNLFEKEEYFLLDNEELEHQMLNVFRYQTGDEVIVFDGRGVDYVGEIEVENKRVKIKIKEVKNPPSLLSEKGGKKVTLFMSLIKKDNFEMVVEKATELGVEMIVPIVTERSQKINLNWKRLNKISVEATEQSGQMRPPVIHEVISLKEALDDFMMPKIAFHMSGKTIQTDHFTKEEIGVLIGPEGGWSERELEFFKTKDIEIVRLDVPVLRAETAALVGCYTVMKKR